MMNRFSRIKYIISILILSLIYFSCDDKSNGSDEEIFSRALLLRLNAISGNISNYTDVYVFNAQVPNANYFHHKVLNVERTSEYLKMSIPTGTWNFILVGCNDSNIQEQLVYPTASEERSRLLMWRTIPQNGILPDVPEIRMALIDGLSITANTDQTASALLERNVAKVRVVLGDGIGFAMGAENTVSLLDVPTSLSWDGSLYPDKDHPEVSSAPMTKSITFTASTTTPGHAVSDTVDFIIPAHKSKSETDVSTHKIRLSVNFKRLSGSDFSKTVEVNTVPKDNHILLLTLTAKGGLEIKTEILDWTTVSSKYEAQLFSFSQTGNTGTLATWKMEMKQERNWWVTLEDTGNFEFVDGTATFGQFTPSPVTIQVRRKTGGTTMSTKLNLFISGFDGLYEQYDVTDLVQ